MNLLRFVSALLLLSVSAFGQAVDYRALGTNSYYTNGLRVNDKHWTNSAGLYRYQPLTGTVAAGQPGPPFVLRSDGSAFVGTNVFQDVAPTASGIFFPYVISMTDSNEPTTVHGDWWAIDSENYGVYAGAALTVQQAGLSTFVLSGDTGPQIRVTSVRGGPGFDAINVSSNTVDGFRVSEGGDLTLINALAYTWPTARGPAGSVLTDAAANGTLTWAPSGGGSASIGPGTNNYYAKFDSTGTNVVNSPTKSAFTNSIEHFLLPNTTGTITFTNGATTNRMYSMFAHSGTNTYLEFVSAVPFSAEAAHIRHVTTGFTSQRAAIYFNDSVAIEPAANQLGGHGAGYIYPLADGTQDNGTTSLRWRDVNLARVVTAPARDDSIIFGTGFTGQGFGVGTAGTLYFTGPGSFGWQMNRDKNTGSPQLDMSSSLLGFGTSTSNSVSYLQESTLTGYVQVGTNNANTATARAQGIIAARASGTDRPGSDLLLAAGMGTGNAISPRIRFQSSNPGSTGSGLNNTLIDRMLIDTNTVTIYSNLVVNGTITSSGGGGGSGASVLFTNNQYSVSFDSSGRLIGTNYAAASLGYVFGTNGTATNSGIIQGAQVIATGGTAPNMTSANGLDVQTGSVTLRGTLSAIGFNVNAGGGFRWPANGTAELRADTVANPVTLYLGNNAAGWPYIQSQTNNADPRFIVNGNVTLTNITAANSFGTITAGGHAFPLATTLVTLTNVVYTNVTINFGSTASASFSDVLVTVANLKSNDVSTINVPAISQTNGVFTSWISNTVLYARYHNYQATAVDPASGIFNMTVQQFK